MSELSTIGYILLFTLIGSIFSLVGGIILLYREKLALKISHSLASFAAGALLGTAFFDLLPEALEEMVDTDIFLWTLVGILSFFVFERFIYFFHHHHEHENPKSKPTATMVILGDSVHNFIDGITIAATFLVNIPLGIITSLAVAAHEIPQEVGDFGILLHLGMTKKRILWVNVVSALSAVLGAVITYFLGGAIQKLLPIFLSLTAGFFIYIAASDLIPEIHEDNRRGFAFIETSLLLFGVFATWIIIAILE